MTLKTIRLELARTPEHPEGSRRHGYEFVAPLNPDGTLNAEEWRGARSRCTVRRFWGDETQAGLLRRIRNGRWIFDYDRKSDSDDEPIFRLDHHHLQEGEYLSITEHDGQEQPFRVTAVR